MCLDSASAGGDLGLDCCLSAERTVLTAGDDAPVALHVDVQTAQLILQSQDCVVREGHRKGHRSHLWPLRVRTASGGAVISLEDLETKGLDCELHCAQE